MIIYDENDDDFDVDDDDCFGGQDLAGVHLHLLHSRHLPLALCAEVTLSQIVFFLIISSQASSSGTG